MSDVFLLQRYRPYLDEAFLQAGHCAVSEDVPVGAVVVDAAGAIIGRGYNQRQAHGDPCAHAEIIALREAGTQRGHWRLHDCTIVVTLEPCVMCAGAIALARIQRVVFAAWEPKTGACGSICDVLRSPQATHQVEIYGGVDQARGQQLLSAFFAQRRQV